MSVTYYRQVIAGNYREAEPIRCIDIKAAVQRVIHHNRWFAAILAWAAFIADLGSDARQSGQTRHTVRAAGLTLIAQVIV